MNGYKHIFGPVPSRRLGVSLGVDLVPLKTCTLNCVYCEVGKTNKMTLDRYEYFTYDTVTLELSEYLSGHPSLDYITFSGSGEPTLNSCVGKLVTFLKRKFPQYKLALLTNGSLFTDAGLREECLGFDLMLPSLDAVSKKVFKKINRPHPDLINEEIIEGLVLLSREFSGEIWLELFIVPGLNDTEEELALLKNKISDIDPDKIQLNYLDRPGAENWVQPLSSEGIDYVISRLEPLKIELIRGHHSSNKIEKFNNSAGEIIISAVKRRPSSFEDLIMITGLKRNELSKYIWQLKSSGIIKSVNNSGKIYYQLFEKDLNN